MTEEQLNEACALAVRHGGAYSSIRATTISYEALASIIAEVRAAERERCAKVCDQWAASYRNVLPAAGMGCNSAASTIRALGQQPAGASDSEEKKG